MWSALWIIIILHGKLIRGRRDHRPHGTQSIPSHRVSVRSSDVSPCLSVWSRWHWSAIWPPCQASPHGFSYGPDSARRRRTHARPRDRGSCIKEIMKWRNLEALLRKATDWGSKRTIQDKKEEEEGKMAQTENGRNDDGKKGVKGRKWSERKWRGQVQWHSRWEEGKSDGRENRESWEVNVATVVRWGVSVSMPVCFSSFSFKELVFFLPFPPVSSLLLCVIFFLFHIQFTSAVWLYVTKRWSS